MVRVRNVVVTSHVGLLLFLVTGNLPILRVWGPHVPVLKIVAVPVGCNALETVGLNCGSVRRKASRMFCTDATQHFSVTSNPSASEIALRVFCIFQPTLVQTARCPFPFADLSIGPQLELLPKFGPIPVQDLVALGQVVGKVPIRRSLNRMIQSWSVHVCYRRALNRMIQRLVGSVHVCFRALRGNECAETNAPVKSRT